MNRKESRYLPVQSDSDVSTSALHQSHITPIDRGILASVIRNPDAPYALWAKENDISAPTVARRYMAMRRRGIVRVIGRTLPVFGGRIAWLVRINAAPSRLGPIAVELVSLPETRWVRHSMDQGELICGIVTMPSAYKSLLSQLHSSIPARDIRVHRLLEVWGAPGNMASTVGYIDELDRRILDEYAQDGRLSAKDIGERIGVDPATVSRHRQKLINSGILFFEADIDPDALTDFGDFNLWLNVQPGRIGSLGRHLRGLPETRYVAAISGPQQIFANVMVSEASNMIDFVDGLWNRGIIAAELVPMGKSLKRSMA